MTSREFREMLRTLPIPAIDRELKKNMGKIVSPDFPGYAITKCEDQNCRLMPISTDNSQEFEKYGLADGFFKYQNENNGYWMDVSKNPHPDKKNYLICWEESDARGRKQNQQFKIEGDYIKTYNEEYLYCLGPNLKIKSSNNLKTKLIWQPLS